MTATGIVAASLAILKIVGAVLVVILTYALARRLFMRNNP